MIAEHDRYSALSDGAEIQARHRYAVSITIDSDADLRDRVSSEADALVRQRSARLTEHGTRAAFSAWDVVRGCGCRTPVRGVG
jgi:hypothetical protein